MVASIIFTVGENRPAPLLPPKRQRSRAVDSSAANSSPPLPYIQARDIEHQMNYMILWITWRKLEYMDDFNKQREGRKVIKYATSKAGSAVELQSIYIETFPLSGCDKLGFPSSACTCVANISWLVK